MAGLLDAANRVLNYHVQGYSPPTAQMGLLSMALPSPWGDAAGLLSDAAGYAADPKSLTVGRGLLTLASILPGIPAALDDAGKTRFMQLFKGSKVVDEAGAPLPVFHSTTADFERFGKTRDIGYHFGTPDQANHVRFTGKSGEGGRTIPAYLSIKNPLQLPDLFDWHPQKIVDQIERLAKTGDYPQITKQVASELDDIRSAAYMDAASKGLSTSNAEYGAIVKKLKELGFDGVRYGNSGEGVRGADAANVAWIAFDPEQILPAFGKY